jgi:uncharacterized membrane protein
MVRFFNHQEERRIIAAIRASEGHTSGEIRVHLEKQIEGDVTAAAFAVFHQLNMDRTAERNGVLIFIVPAQRQFAIIGDEGINRKVPPHFWADVRDVMQHYFRQGQFTDGVCEGVLLVGQKLKEFFPRQSNDQNELPDEISYGGETA